MADIAVVGAGIVGSCIALELQRRGAQVTLVDRNEPGSGCSYGNLGAISQGSVAPLAMPGLLATLPGMLFDDESPLRLPLGHLAQATPWLIRFVLASNRARVERSAARLSELHAGAYAMHETLTRELGVPELFLAQGHLHLYPDASALAKDSAGWALRQRYGVEFSRLDRPAILDLEPNISSRYNVGIYLADHATILNPLRYVQAMVRGFQSAGGVVRKDEVLDISRASSGQWRLSTTQGSPTADPGFDHVVVAGGAWSRRLLAPLGVACPVETQRGYHAEFKGRSGLGRRTVVLADRKIFVAPMEHGLRIGGTVEFGGLTAAPDLRRAAMLERIARETFAGLRDSTAEHWMGHRPCMPDSVPLVGRAPGHRGLWLAVGHGHLGLTDSVGTAKQIATSLLAGEEPPRAAPDR